MRADDSKSNLKSLPEAILEAGSKDGNEISDISPVRKGANSSWSQKLDEFFKVTEKGSTLQTEIRAGFINWMTMCYILVVNPVILGSADPDSHVSTETIMTATAVSSAIGCLVVALSSDVPLGLMPGMGLNAYFSFGICRSFHVTFGQALSCCFVSGAALLLLAVLGVCQWIVTTVLSEHLKKAITVAIGVFQALIGFQVMGLVVASPNTLVTLGDVGWSNKQLYLALMGFCLISAMLVSRLHGALLVGICLMSVCAWSTGLSDAPLGVFSLPRYDAGFLLDFSCWDPGSGKLHAMILGSMVLLFVALFDLAGVQYGLMGIAGLLQDGHVPRSQCIFSSAAIATMSGAVIGTSPVIIANESSAGIVEGAKTGLSALVISGLFLVSAFLTPLLSSIPRVATSVPLVLIGAFMMAPCRGIDWDNLRAAIPSFLTITVVPFTYSIHNGIIAGILMDAFLMVSAKKDQPPELTADPHLAQPLIPQSGSRVQSPVLERVFSTPHASMAFAPEKVSDQVEQAQHLLEQLRRTRGLGHEPDQGGGIESGEDRLLSALEAYVQSHTMVATGLHL